MATIRQLRFPESATPAILVAGVAAGVGVLAAKNPLLALLAVCGALFVFLVMENLTLGLFVFVAVSFLEALPKILPVVTVAKAMGVLLVVSWLVSVAVRPKRMPSFISARPALFTLLVLFVVWVGASLLWAQESAPVHAELTRFLPLFVLFLILYAALRTRRDAMIFALVLIAGAIASAVAGIFNPPPPEYQGAGRLAGAGAGANALAPVLVAGAVLSAAFAGMRARGVIVRLLALVAGGFCIVGVVLTGSRGGLVGLGAALLAGIVFAGRGRRIAVVPFVVTALSLCVLYVAVLAPPIIRERIAHPGDGSGRVDIWQVGVQMVKANPVLGVGAGNFKARSPEYVLNAGIIRRSDLIVDRPHVPHNIYLQVLSQLGIVGLLLFLGIISAALATAVRAARLFTRQRDEQMELLARALVIALCGMLAAGFFGSWLFSKPLWLLLALCPAVLAVAQRQSSERPQDMARTQWMVLPSAARLDGPLEPNQAR